MTPRPWLSVLVPMYNVQPYLRECVGSVMRQWQPGIELLLLDDGSTDGTLALAEALCKRWPDRLRLLQQPANAGISEARNRLLQTAQGEFIWFLDSDDKLLPGALAGLHACIAEHDPDLVMCDFRTFRERGRLKDRWRDRRRRCSCSGRPGRLRSERMALLRHVLEAGQLHPWSKIARRRVWSQVRFPRGRNFEDVAAIPSLLLGTRRWVHVPQAWVGYRLRPGSIVHAPNGRSMADLALSLRDLHGQVAALADAAGDRVLRDVLDRFCLHRISAAARWCSGSDQPLPLDIPALLQGMYPDGIGEALQRIGRWRWWWRAWRVRRRFRQAGWLPPAAASGASAA